MPLLDLFWTILLLFLLFAWFWLLITIFIDIFRSDDLSGWAKAFWVIFVIFLPLLGVLVYIIARGSSMQERQMRQAADMRKAQDAYIREVAGSGDGGGSSADELAKLADLHKQGVLTDDEFAAQKAKLLS